MRLRDRALETLAQMVVGDNSAFPYRSRSHITRFFSRCGLPYVHDGTTRWRWARDVLEKLNLGHSHSPDLPSDDLLQVVAELFESDDFDASGKSRNTALDELNKLLSREGLAAYFDSSDRCNLRNTGTGIDSSILPQRPRPLSREEIAQRQIVSAFLDSATEDEFTEKLLVPLFQRLGFHRVSP